MLLDVSDAPRICHMVPEATGAAESERKPERITSGSQQSLSTEPVYGPIMDLVLDPVLGLVSLSFWRRGDCFKCRQPRTADAELVQAPSMTAPPNGTTLNGMVMRCRI